MKKINKQFADFYLFIYLSIYLFVFIVKI